MKKLFLIFPLLALFACESSEIDSENQEEIVPVDQNQLIVSNTTPNVLEPVKFRFTVKTNGLPISQLYDSITFSVSGVDKELRVYNIAYEDPGNPYGNPAEFELSNWHHYFMVAGNYQTSLHAYKNSVKTTLVSSSVTVSQPYDFYNIDWNNYAVGKKSYFNQTGNFGLYLEVKKGGTYLVVKPAIEVNYSFDGISWPYSESINEQGKAVLYSHMTQSFGLPTYTEADNLKVLFDENFTINLPADDLVHNIWLTEKNKIALIEVRTDSGVTLKFKLYAEKR